MCNIYDFDSIFRTECYSQHFTRNCRIKNLNDFERYEAGAYLWKAKLLNVKEKANGHMLHYEEVLGNVFERRESKCCAVLMKHLCKVKGEQVITLQIAQQLRTKNINVVPAQLFCRQCKAKFLLETDSLY